MLLLQAAPVQHQQPHARRPAETRAELKRVRLALQELRRDVRVRVDVKQ